MNNETRAKIVKAAPNRWLVFCILTLSGGIAFKLSSMKDMFYVPMQQFMGLTNKCLVQLGDHRPHCRYFHLRYVQ